MTNLPIHGCLARKHLEADFNYQPPSDQVYCDNNYRPKSVCIVLICPQKISLEEGEEGHSDFVSKFFANRKALQAKGVSLITSRHPQAKKCFWSIL